MLRMQSFSGDSGFDGLPDRVYMLGVWANGSTNGFWCVCVCACVELKIKLRHCIRDDIISQKR